MKYLGPNGLQHFYDKYIRPLKGAAYKDVANDLITTEEGSVLDARQGKALEDKKIDKTKIVNNLTTTIAGCALDARQGKVLDERIGEINTYLSELAQITLDSSAFAILSHWQIMVLDAWKEGNTVHFGMEISTSAILQENHLYTINDPELTDVSIRPKKLSFLNVFATDSAYAKTVSGTGLITPDGAIQINLPSSNPYVFLTGEYRISEA